MEGEKQRGGGKGGKERRREEGRGSKGGVGGEGGLGGKTGQFSPQSGCFGAGSRDFKALSARGVLACDLSSGTF